MPIPNDMLKMVNTAIKYAQASSQLDKIYEDLAKWCEEFGDINYNRSKWLCRDALDLLCQATIELEKAGKDI